MKNTNKLFAMVISGMVSTSVVASDIKTWSITTNFGVSEMSDLNGATNNVNGSSGSADISLDGGFTAGAGIAYHYSERLAVQFAWEYRSNDSEVLLANGQRFTEGNYASNLFFLNGLYYLQPISGFTPYVGAGLSWIQEVDIDLERDGNEQSYSGDGEIGLQLLAGLSYDFAQHWSFAGELRVADNSDISLEGEGVAGEFSGLSYDPVTVQLGVNYNF